MIYRDVVDLYYHNHYAMIYIWFSVSPASKMASMPLRMLFSVDLSEANDRVQLLMRYRKCQMLPAQVTGLYM